MSEKLSWEDFSTALQKVGEISPRFLKEAIIVGGGAALCYNGALLNTSDSRFKPVVPQSGQTNYSHDLDFTNVFFSDFEKEFSPFLKYDDISKRKFLEIQGVKIGFLQFGCTFDPEEEIKIAKQFTLNGTDFKINVLNPVSLFREKTYLIEKGRGKANDHFHREIAKTYAVFEYHQSLLKPERTKTLLAHIQDKAPELVPEIQKIPPVLERSNHPIQDHPSDLSRGSR